MIGFGCLMAGAASALAQGLDIPSPAAGTSAPPMLTPLLPALSDAQDRFLHRIDDLLAAPAEVEALAQSFSAWLLSAEGVRSLADLIILFVVGVGLEWLYWTYAFSALKAADIAEPGSPPQALWLGLRRFLLKSIGLLIFAVSSIAASTGLDWPEGTQDFVLTAILVIALIRFAGIVLHLFLARPARGQRLVPIEPQRARLLQRLALSAIALLIAGALIPASLERISDARHTPELMRLIAATAAMAILLAAIAHTARTRKKGAAQKRNRLPPFPKIFFASFTLILIYVLWLGGAGRLAFTLAVVACGIAAEGALRPAVRFFWPHFGEPDAEFSVLPGLVLRVMRLFVGCVGVLAIILAWDLPILQVSMSESPTGRLVSHLLEALALVLLGDLAWAAIKGIIDSRLRHLGPIEIDGGAPGPNARLVTLLPLLRTALGVALAALLTLSVLSVLGFQITPFLAGAGVLGIALGFGAQTLVRDVLSGVFYLAEDVFRVGEYIESGSSTKGTVERITLRSVALRHHNGPLHFVPYGTLGAVRNNSRDWIIEKFDLPLPVTVDSEFVRKLLKKIGQQMFEDEELGPLMLAPMKAKLYRIDPGVKIFRCKVQSPPGKQFEVRAAAYKRIEAALKQADIPFADTTVRLVQQAPEPRPMPVPIQAVGTRQ